jgi:hypothetical protein
MQAAILTNASARSIMMLDGFSLLVKKSRSNGSFFIRYDGVGKTL